MNLVFEKLTRTLAANEQWLTRIAGNFFRLSVAANPVTVRLFKDNREIGSMSNLLSGDYVRDVPFDAVQVENGGIGQSVTIQLAGGGAGSDRVLGEVTVTGGPVSVTAAAALPVTEFDDALTLAGKRWISGRWIAASAISYNHVQLWNPAASAKNYFVEQLHVQTDAAECHLRDSAASLGTLQSATANVSKLLGGAAPALEMYLSQQSTLGGVNNLLVLPIQAGVPRVFEFDKAICIPPNRGLLVVPGAVNTYLKVIFEVTEKAV